MLNIFSDEAIQAIIAEVEQRAGKSIKSVGQTGASLEDGGENIITITLSNGESMQVSIRNGSRGSAGPQGPKGDTGPVGPAGKNGACNASYAAGSETIKFS